MPKSNAKQADRAAKHTRTHGTRKRVTGGTKAPSGSPGTQGQMPEQQQPESHVETRSMTIAVIDPEEVLECECPLFPMNGYFG